MTPRSRRQFLLASAPLVATLAGCAATEPEVETTDESASSDESPEADESTSTTSPSTTETAPATESTSTDESTPATGEEELDLREANVVAVAVEPRDGAYRFDVTLIHDDEGEDGYANWWQVETLNGERLGRRELLHAHGTQEFTRSETVEIPEGTACVVVRGHDQTHGYGGRAMLVNLETGATKVVRQGSERQSVADATCV